MSTPNGTSLKGICYDGHHILEVFLPADHQEADNIMSCDEKKTISIQGIQMKCTVMKNYSRNIDLQEKEYAKSFG